eukprot:76938_1
MSAEDTKRELKQLCDNPKYSDPSQSDILKLLIALRLKVYMKIDKSDSNHTNDNCCGKFQQKIKNAKDSISNILRDNKDKSLPVYSNVSPSDNTLDTFNQFEWYV